MNQKHSIKHPFLFAADKTDDKFHRRANVKMGVRVIFRTDVLNAARPENFATLVNNQLSPPAVPPSGPEPLSCLKSKRMGDKIDSFSKIRLSPKTFRFSGRFGRSKSEVERCTSEPSQNFTSKSFQEVSALVYLSFGIVLNFHE